MSLASSRVSIQGPLQAPTRRGARPSHSASPFAHWTQSTDGVRGGFDLEMLEAVCSAVSVPVIASGGAGCIEDFTTLFHTLPKVDAGLAASIFHFGTVKIADLKQKMAESGIPTRL